VSDTLTGPDWLSIRQAAERCGVSCDTVRRALRAERFPNAARTSHDDRGWRISLADLVAAGFTLASPYGLHSGIAPRTLDLSESGLQVSDTQGEVERLRGENAALRAENTRLREHTLTLLDKVSELLGAQR
jgi:hypothetical protein